MSTKPSIYVAGAVAEVDRAAAAVAALRSHGFEITHDWPAQVMASPDVKEQEIDASARREIAIDSLLGVVHASVVWLLVPAEERGRGSWVEFGYALGVARFRDARFVKPPVIIVSGDVQCSAFTELAQYRFATDAETVAWLRGRYEGET